MSVSAELVAEFLPQFCPTTNHYRCTDGERTWYLLITIPTLDSLGVLQDLLGVPMPVSEAHLSQHADVFLADENAVVLDADMDPSNGMTAIAHVPGCETHADVLKAIGHELV